MAPLVRVACAAIVAAVILCTASPRAQTPPRLLVVLVVDQMRADYLTRFRHTWTGGLRLLLEQGAVYDHTTYPYLATWTCAGHATIGTGTFPHTHGMITNRWWRRDERRTAECTDDASAPAVSYGRASRTANSAKQLRVPTLADELRMQKPGARVVAMSLKSRSAITLAGHAGDAITWFDEGAGAWVTSSAFTPGPVPAVERFMARDPFEADQGRVWALRDPAARYAARDAGAGERPPAPWTSLFPHRLQGQKPLGSQFFDIWQTSPFADAYLGRMAAALVDDLALGQRDVTDFLAIGFSALDEVGHDFGPDSREVDDTLRHLDTTIGTLIAHLDDRVGRDRYVLALSADHGVAPIAQPGAGGRIFTEDIRDRIEDTLRDRLGPRDDAPFVDAVSEPHVYLAPGVGDRLRAEAAAFAAVRTAVEAIPGVARVMRTDRLSATSPDRLVRAAALSVASSSAGDLIVVPRPGFYFSTRVLSNATTHGSPYEYDTHVPLILLGGRIASRHVARPVTPADIAPTLAALAGVRLPLAEGRVLREVVR
jgi:predicted AlkP superfamily pyrophosphatase or phosphodiesterase